MTMYVNIVALVVQQYCDLIYHQVENFRSRSGSTASSKISDVLHMYTMSVAHMKLSKHASSCYMH